ncbi:MAG TPA: hypothetical protein VFS97_04555 [Nitrososphaeraceae archaeon]|nr:hypothetical protein [Nitrososphaeraceae archaeon]
MNESSQKKQKTTRTLTLLSILFAVLLGSTGTLALATTMLGGVSQLFPSAEAAPPAYRIEISSAETETGTITCTSGPNSGNIYGARLNTDPQDAPVVKKKGGDATEQGTVLITGVADPAHQILDTFVTSGQSNGRTSFTLAGSANDNFCSGGFSTPITITGSCGIDRQINVVGDSLTGAFTGDVTCTRV